MSGRGDSMCLECLNDQFTEEELLLYASEEIKLEWILAGAIRVAERKLEVSTSDLAERLQISKSTLYRYREGKLSSMIRARSAFVLIERLLYSSIPQSTIRSYDQKILSEAFKILSRYSQDAA
jgi:hypothetical protein